MKNACIFQLIAIFLGGTIPLWSGTPQETFKAYIMAAKDRDFDKLWTLQAKLKNVPERIQQQEREIARSNFERNSTDADFVILSQRLVGECAVIITREVKHGVEQAMDLDPVFLVKQDGEWNICRTLKRVEAVAPEKIEVFSKLEAWFQGFKHGVRWSAERTSGDAAKPPADDHAQ